MLIQIRNLSKSYGGVHALSDVTMDIAAGEVHALCGENGAGKSTLIKVLTGVVRADGGNVLIAGESMTQGNVQASERAGIAVMHQESTAFPDLSTIDNIFVGREMRRMGGLLLDRPAMRKGTLELLERLGESINVDVPVGTMPIAQRQMVAMARALSMDCRLLIMDEPTASLSARETQTLLSIVDQLRQSGISVLYVSHRLEEIFQIADRVTVLRDGELVATHPISDIDTQRLIKLMVADEATELATRHEHEGDIGDVVLDVRGLSLDGVYSDITFKVRAGEIVGMAGLVGAGRSEVARGIFGIDAYDTGSVRINGEALAGGSVSAAMSAGLAMVPEDRQHEGLVLDMSVGANISLAVLRQLTRNLLVSSKQEARLVERQMESLRVKAAGDGVAAATLSGGNQQKLVIAKWLASEPKVLILDEPTRGVDVGAKAQVHKLTRELAASGLATLVISSELEELLSVCDRILVMREGWIVGELEGKAATKEQVLALALPDASAA